VSLGGRALRGRFDGYGGYLGRRGDKSLKMRGLGGLFIEKIPLFTLGQTLTLALFWASI